MIDSFRGPYRFLSNFANCKVWYEDEIDGRWYKTTEHAYQAAKTLDKKMRKQIQEAATPGDAKRLGNKITLRPNWDKLKIEVMETVCRQKFFLNSEYRKKLLATGNEELVEGNTWGDKFWGKVGNTGQNWLGRILMKIRKELQDGN
jgi:N-glycosidase YbiA